MAMLISNRLVQRLTVFSLKLYELIQSSEAGVYIFSFQFLLKIPVFEVSYRFAFHRT